MAAYDRAALGAALKDVYEDKIGDLVLSKSYFLDSLERADTKEFPGGELLKWLVDVQPNTSYAINNMDGGALPDPGRRVQVRAAADVADHDGSCGMTQDAIDRARSGEAAFFSVIEKSKRDLIRDLRKKINPQLFKQLIWVVTADSTGTTVTLDNVQYIQIGDVLTFGNRTTEAGATTRAVTDKNITANTITVDSAVTVTAANSGAWFAGAGPVATKFIESLDLAASTGRTLHGINSSTYKGWDGNSFDLASAAADEDDIITLVNQVWERELGEVDNLISTIGIQKRVAAGLVSQKRFNDAQAVNLRAGYKGLMIGAANTEIPLVAERDVPKGRLYAYDSKALRLYKGPQEFVTPPDASGIFRYVRNAAGQALSTFAATYRLKLNVLYDNPAAIGRLINCQDDKPVFGG